MKMKIVLAVVSTVILAGCANSDNRSGIIASSNQESSTTNISTTLHNDYSITSATKISTTITTTSTKITSITTSDAISETTERSATFEIPQSTPDTTTILESDVQLDYPDQYDSQIEYDPEEILTPVDLSDFEYFMELSEFMDDENNIGAYVSCMVEVLECSDGYLRGMLWSWNCDGYWGNIVMYDYPYEQQYGDVIRVNGFYVGKEEEIVWELATNPRT